MVIHALKNLYLKINIIHEKIYPFRTIVLHYCESLLDCIEGVGNIGTKSISPFISSPNVTRSTVLIVCFLFFYVWYCWISNIDEISFKNVASGAGRGLKPFTSFSQVSSLSRMLGYEMVNLKRKCDERADALNELFLDREAQILSTMWVWVAFPIWWTTWNPCKGVG